MIHKIFTVGQDYKTWQRANHTLAKTVFLAGPIERVVPGKSRSLPRWRDEALVQLNASGVPCIVFTPEWSDPPYGWSYEKQVLWELEHLKQANIILFWIPRCLPSLPGFTTNIEFGEWIYSDKIIIIGAPPQAPHMRYIQLRCEMLRIPWHTTLESCCAEVAIQLHSIGD